MHTTRDLTSQSRNFRGTTTHFSQVGPQFLKFYHVAIDFHFSAAKQCNERGDFLTSNVPPVLPTVRSVDDWSPFHSYVGFELADFLFSEAELSRKKVNQLLELWAATLVPYGISPPITNHAHLLQQIDSVRLGDVPWDSFSLSYDDPPPKTACPPEWKTTEYEVWFRNPRSVVREILRNPEFNGHIDYSAYQEFEDSQRRYCNMMSGDWAWRQSVRHAPYKFTAITDPGIGHHLHRLLDTWRDVCPHYPRIGQNNGVRRNRPKRVLPPLSFHR